MVRGGIQRRAYSLPVLNRVSLYLAVFLLLSTGAALAACGQEDPSPESILSRTLTPAGLAAGKLDGAVVRVQSLGYEDRVLKERTVAVPDPVLAGLRRGLADGGEGFRRLIRDLRYRGKSEVAGWETDHLSGRLDLDGLKGALGQEDVSGILGGAGVTGGDGTDPAVPGPAGVESLVGADFDLYSGVTDSAMRQLDLTLALGDTDNALPPVRIRFILTGESADNGAEQNGSS